MNFETGELYKCPDCDLSIYKTVDMAYIAGFLNQKNLMSISKNDIFMFIGGYERDDTVNKIYAKVLFRDAVGWISINNKNKIQKANQ